MREPRYPIAALLLGAFFFVALPSHIAALEGAEETIWPTQQWLTSMPEEQGMDSAALATLIDFGASRNLDSLLIVRHGRIVIDAYYAPYNADLLHVINSSTKAVVGTLAAITLKDGLLDSTSHPLMDFFDGQGVANLDDKKKSITLQSLLDMTSGMAWQEPLNDAPPETMLEMERSPNWVRFILDRPMAGAPGDSFNYNSGNPHLLSAILGKLTGMSAEDYAKAKLFGPLGITEWKWRRDPQGVSTGGYGLALRPRDMAKFGYLYLHGGEWAGQQLLPPDWVEKVNHASVKMNVASFPALRYSNLFWALPDKQIYWANGYHCQMIVVFPTLDMVAVTTARDNCQIGKMTAYIPQAVKSAIPLPPNPAASDLLANALRDIAIETPTKVAVAPPIAAAVSGKIYNFPRNSLSLKSLSLTFDDEQSSYEVEVSGGDAILGRQLKSIGPIGLDGLYRKGAPTTAGVSAVRGRWLNAHTFEIERLTIGAGFPEQKWTLFFDGEMLNLRGKDFDDRVVSIDGKRGN